jgi:APA family basic amino acid/polyamine antiporter
MFGLGWEAWRRFAIWLAIGTVIYIVYGYRHSHLRRLSSSQPPRP